MRQIEPERNTART